MTATNMCSNFGGFRCRRPISNKHEYMSQVARNIYIQITLSMAFPLLLT